MGLRVRRDFEILELRNVNLESGFYMDYGAYRAI